MIKRYALLGIIGGLILVAVGGGVYVSNSGQNVASRQTVAVVATSPSPASVIAPSPVASPSVAPTTKPTAAPVAPAPVKPPAAPAPVAPKPTPKPAPSPVPVVHSVTWNDPTPGIDAAIGGILPGPTTIGSGLTAANVSGSYTCSAAPTNPGFEVGIRDVTTGQVVWGTFDSAAKTAGSWVVAFQYMDTPGDVYQIEIQFFGTGITCDWSLTLKA